MYISNRERGLVIPKSQIDFKNASSKDTNSHEKLIDINHRGRFFLNQSGGYTKSHKQYILKTSWIVAKTIAAIANACIIIYVSIWAVKSSNQSKELEKKLSEKDSIIIYKNFIIEKLEKKQSS